MTRNQYFFIVSALILVTLGSCTPYRKIKPQRAQALSQGDSVETMRLSDFDRYAFNICEYYTKNSNGSNRFVACPPDFFKISANDSIKKVEELYLLKHRTSDLVVYLTTASHQYIGKQKGFLNDSTLYKERFYLRDIDYVYIGKVDATKDSILFENQRDDSKMICHLATSTNTESKIEIEAVNAETVENRGKFEQRIHLNEVFAIPFRFTKSNYQLYDVKPEQDRKLIKNLHILLNKKGKKEVMFQRSDLLGYKYPAGKVLYAPKK